MIVQPSAMQRVAAALAGPPTTPRAQVPPPKPSAPSERPLASLRFSDITPEVEAALRIEASLEACYPHLAEKQGSRRASVILAGHKAWRETRARVINRSDVKVPGTDQNPNPNLHSPDHQSQGRIDMASFAESAAVPKSSAPEAAALLEALRSIAFLRPGGPTRNKLAMQMERIAIDAMDEYAKAVRP